MSVHSGLLSDLADQLAEAGCDVWAGDLRGHGQSVSDRAPFAHLDPAKGVQGLLDDTAAFARRAFQGVPFEDRVMIGGVLSGQLMLHLAHRDPTCAKHLVMAPPSPRRAGAGRLATSFLRLRLLTHKIDRPDHQIKHHVYSFLKANLPAGSRDAEVISAFPDVLDRILADPQGFPTPTLGYWLTVLPWLDRSWDEIGPGGLSDQLRVMIVSSPDDPQLQGRLRAAQIIDWFGARGVPDASYLELIGSRANPMVDARHLPLAQSVLRWVSQPDEAALLEGDRADARPIVLSASSEGAGGAASPAQAHAPDLPELIRLCYEALDDDAQWVALIHRLCLAFETDPKRVELILESVQPHWQRAYDLREELRRAAALGVLYNDVIDRLDLGVALLDPDGSIRHSNSAFERALAALGPAGRSQTDTMSFAANLLNEQPWFPTTADHDLPILWKGVVVGVSFVPASKRAQQSENRGVLPRMIVLRPHADQPAQDDHRAALLALSYGMTRQESLVALLLSDGLGTPEAALHLGISEHTLRSHLKQVFEKMNVSSRTEMSKLILSSPLGWLVEDIEGPRWAQLNKAGPK
jgi:DNA-binding CsgD family transcriptional regulator/alpha-beta hydrolase superfamily lysophospholipase